MPLYMCPTSPTIDEYTGESAYPVLPDGRTVKLASSRPTQSGVYQVNLKNDGIDSDESDTDSDIELTIYDEARNPHYENLHDPYTSEELRAEAKRGREDPIYLARCYWKMREVTRKYRAAAGRFGPRRRRRQANLGERKYKPNKHHDGQRQMRNGKGVRKFKRKRGFFLAEFFVSFDTVPEDVCEVFFNQDDHSARFFSKRRKGAPKHQIC